MKFRIPVPVRLGIGIALVGVLVWQYPVSWERLASVFSSLNWYYLTLALVLILNQYIISSTKWKLILRSHDIDLPLSYLTRSYMIASFFGAFMPSAYLGDVVRVVDVGKQTGQKFDSATAVVLERLSGLVALSLAGGISSLYVASTFADRTFLWLGLTFLAGSVLALCTLLSAVRGLLWRGVDWLDSGRIQSALGRVLGAVDHYADRPRLLLKVAGWSLVFQLAAYFIFWTYGRVIGIELPYIYCLAFVPAIYLLEAIPISVAGLGLREGALVFFLGKLGYSSSEALALSIVVLTCRYGMHLLGGLLYAYDQLTESRLDGAAAGPVD